jgi:hypothetical protein
VPTIVRREEREITTERYAKEPGRWRNDDRPLEVEVGGGLDALQQPVPRRSQRPEHLITRQSGGRGVKMGNVRMRRFGGGSMEPIIHRVNHP